ncbi:MAG: deoxycytidine triphosphate deaminase [SAR86 cluster bacterium]|uniref:Deoxycytidine triphosphate deaminase n=1 Tax=SAR86 cluster bacterium TaxID=2030880 RepID=A0A2A5B276_9GAMM|nr:MAG: deoxycytidine triphosphate deaminase [SAR86 cluster bacterium]
MTTESTDKDVGNQQLEIEAATFKRLLEHLDNHKDVQNIDLMNLASFCRNCLSKWYRAEAQARGLDIDYESAREIVYGMPYSQWKSKYQSEATAEQLQKFKEHSNS